MYKRVFREMLTLKKLCVKIWEKECCVQGTYTAFEVLIPLLMFSCGGKRMLLQRPRKINAAKIKFCSIKWKKLLHAKFHITAVIWSILFYSCFLSFIYHHIIVSDETNLAWLGFYPSCRDMLTKHSLCQTQ